MSTQPTRPPEWGSTPSVTTVFVIRHAESVANAGSFFASQSDSPLSERGKSQVASLVRAFGRVALRAVYSSDLSRSMHTVEPIATAHELPVITTSLLRERDMGDFTGMSFDDAKSRHPDIWARMLARDIDVAPPNGESHHDLSARVRTYLAETLAKHHGHAILIGSHGGTIHHLIRQLCGLDDVRVGPWFAVANASVSRIDRTEVAPGRISTRLAYANRVVVETGDPAFS